MIKAIIHARLVLPSGLLENGAVLYENGAILQAGPMETVDTSCADEILDAAGRLVGPGFVDIHCHAGGSVWAWQDPVGMAKHHLAGGTTSILCTMYHEQTPEQILQAARWIRQAMQDKTPGNIAGIHMEGPYLSPKYGAHLESARKPDPAEYETYIREFGDLIGQWTYSPEVEGNDAFAERLHELGFTMSIGHSEASFAMVEAAVKRGATICTHITDATGTWGKTQFDGTKEVSFDQACMYFDELYCEIINDSLGAHVRPAMSRCIIKTVGLDRIIAVTDACTGTADAGTDVNVVNGELYGSLLRMIDCARNFSHNTDLTPHQVFTVCAANPARAIGLTDVGTIEPGKKANFVIIDGDWDLKQVILEGEPQLEE